MSRIFMQKFTKVPHFILAALRKPASSQMCFYRNFYMSLPVHNQPFSFLSFSSQPTRLLENWIKEFLKHVEKSKPKLVALHLQEVGGKTYEKSMEYVQQFIKILCESSELKEFKRARIFLDEDFKSAEHFTVSISDF